MEAVAGKFIWIKKTKNFKSEKGGWNKQTSWGRKWKNKINRIAVGEVDKILNSLLSLSIPTMRVEKLRNPTTAQDH